MNIVVCIKQVPDTYAERRLTDSDHTLDRESAEGVMNEQDEFAVEEALRIKEAHGGEVTVLSMGPERTVETIRKALSMGADKGVHVYDDALHGSDALATSAALAGALRTLDYDLVLCGTESTDARMGVVPAMLAERLGVAQLTFARKVDVDAAASTVRIERVTEAGYDVVTAATPAVVSVVEKINEPRYPSFKGIMTAKKKPLAQLSLTDIGLTAAEVGTAAATSTVVDATTRPPRQRGQLVTDDGTAGTRIAEFLAERNLI